MFLKISKFIFFSLVLSVIFVPAISYAIDQRCWTKLTCASETGFTDSFYQSDETRVACGGETILGSAGDKELVGFCVAAGTAETKVDFGGKSSFANIGEFIKWIYKYGVQVAGILAVVMIIVAGFIWATSGGSPEKITSAKKKIGGAMMGLFLAVMSYFILNLINPYLINLRMPQVWMINTSGLTPTYCDQIEDGKKVSEGKGGPFKIEPATSACGKEYFVEGTPDLICKGRFCESSICVVNGKEKSSDPEGKSCYTGMLGGSVGAEKTLFGMCSDLDGNIIDNDLILTAICSNGDIEEIKKENLADEVRWYIFGKNVAEKEAIKSNIQDYEVECAKEGGAVVGFYLGADVNDEGTTLAGLVGLIGLPSCAGSLASSGCDDWHAIGKGADGMCNVNLSIVASRISKGADSSCKGAGGIEFCSCSTISLNSFMKSMAANKEFTKYLMTKEELLKGLTCDIFIDRKEFPALDNKGGLVECATLNPFDDPTYCWQHQAIDIF